MTITPSQIDLWRSGRSEHQRLEFKEAKAQFDTRKLFEYCVALANEGGGHLLLGVSDKPPRRIVGTEAFDDVVAISQRLFEKLGFRVDTEAVLHPDGRVVVFIIPSRPRGTAYDLEGKYLMRAGASVVAMTEDQLRRIFAEGAPDWLTEHCKHGLNAQQVVELLDTQAFFELLKLPYPTVQSGVLERLVKEQLVDCVDEGYSVRRIGALLLGKRLSDFGDISRKAARVVVYSSFSKLETKLDQMGEKGYAVGFQGLVQFVMSQLPQNEVVRDALRIEARLVPEIVIRELVANALIHQDFPVIGSSVMVEIYSDRVEISNPGIPFISTERFIDEYLSRNERLADLMRRFGICEEKGSGVDKVISAVEKYQLPAPDFRVGEKRTSVVLFGHQDIEDMDRNDRIRACYQHCCLRYVTNQKMTNQSLRERFKLSDTKVATISQVIAATVDAGKIKAADPSQTSTRYRNYVPFWA